MSTAAPAPASKSANSDKQAAFAKGLEGVIGGQTAVCSIEQDKLIYRGYEIHDLAAHATFEEVAFLLLEGHKPSADELKRFKAEIIAERSLPAFVTSFIESTGGWLASGRAVPMDVLRSAVSLLAHTDPDSQSVTKEANLRKAKRLLAKIPTIIGHMQNVIDGRAIVGRRDGGDPSLSHAANMLYMMTGRKPSADEAKVIDVSLILYAEHEFNASTFTARVVTSTLSDLYSAVVAAITALKGPLHGGANEEAIRLMNRFRSADEAREWTQDALARKEKIMGFGHRVYKNGDHRARILEKRTEELARERDALWRMDVYHAIKDTVWEQKKLHPNLDFPCGLAYFLLGLPIDIYTPLFVASRVSGWCAHIIEQHENNRIIRPRSKYIGPALRKVVPIEQR
jgi:2-methylcitrate synthase/citrate synthase II